MSKVSWLVGILFFVAALIPFLDQVTVLKGTVPILHIAEPYGFTFEEIPDLSGRVFLVTGSNSGLGKFTAKHLALHGGQVALACRRLNKCDEAKWEIEVACKERGVACKLETFTLDLASLKSVKTFAAEFQKSHQKLHGLILNAGVMFGDFALSEDGIENQFATNHIGHFYLTKLLLPLLKASQPSTIVSVSSLAHCFSLPEGIRSSLAKLNDPDTYDPVYYYGQSKLANVLFTKELARQLKEEGAQVYANVVHPGAVRGNLTRHVSSLGITGQLASKMDSLTQKLFYWDEDISSLTVLLPAVGPKIFENKVSGQYYVPIARLPGNAMCTDKADNATYVSHFWKFSEEILEEKLKNIK